MRRRPSNVHVKDTQTPPHGEENTKGEERNGENCPQCNTNITNDVDDIVVIAYVLGIDKDGDSTLSHNSNGDKHGEGGAIFRDSKIEEPRE